MKVTFVNEPTIKPVGNGDGWMLCDDFFVRVDSEDAGDPPVTFTVPMGSTTDLASVPRLPGAYLLFGGRARRSAILHDWLYENRFQRKWADDVFRAAMKEEEINPVTRFFEEPPHAARHYVVVLKDEHRHPARRKAVLRMLFAGGPLGDDIHEAALPRALAYRYARGPDRHAHEACPVSGRRTVAGSS